MLFSIGDCPVCSDSGAVLILRSSADDVFVFYCPLCGVAWAEPPVGNQLDEVLSLTDLAHAGVRLPMREELEQFDARYSVREIAYTDWEADLAPHLR